MDFLGFLDEIWPKLWNVEYNFEFSWWNLVKLGGFE
jgi:hypothetical protein